MTNKHIVDTANNLIKTQYTNNPFEIANSLGIEIVFLGGLKKLKGVYKLMLNDPFIFINDSLSTQDQMMICAHELGHHMLHSEYAANDNILEYTLFDTSNRLEYEANLFAAQLLIDEKRLLSLIYDYGYNAEQISQELNININLIALKVDNLISNGQPLHSLDMNSNFLK